MHSYDIISNKNLAIRRSNRQHFVRRIDGEKWDQTVSILMLCYNHIDQFFSMLDRLDKEPRRKDFMVTIVQNSDKEEAKKIFDERITKYDHITVIYPISNLWSAGGYALGQEYILSQWYSHLIMLEDDVELHEDDTISHTLDHIETIKQVVFIQPPINTTWSHSRYVQYACYPTALLERSWVVDPRYYFRAEDLEWWKRLERAMKTYWYSQKVLERNYFHPYLKWVNNSWSWIYFSLRNQLRTIKKHGEWIPQYFIALVQYRAFGFLVLLRTGKSQIIHCIGNAIPDGLGHYRKLDYNQSEITYHLNRYEKIHIEDLWFKTKEVWYEVLEKGINVEHIIAKTTLAWADREHLAKYSWDIVVSGGFQPVRGTLAACMKKLIVIENFHRKKKHLEGKILKQSTTSQVINILLFLPCVLLWLAAALVSSIALLRVRFIAR